MSFTNLDLGTTVNITNSNNNSTAVTFKAVTGTSDAATINLQNVVGGSELNVTGIENLSLNGNGAVAQQIGFHANTAPNSLTIAGTSAITFDDANTTSETIDASGHSGAIIMTSNNANAVTYTGSSSIDTLTMTGNAVVDTISLGAGNDRVNFTAGLAVTDVVSGGDGTDILSGGDNEIRQVVGVARTTNLNISGFETVNVDDPLAGALTIANIQATGVTKVSLNGAANGSLVMAAGDMTVTIADSLGGNLTVTDTGTAITDTLTISSASLDSEDLWNTDALLTNGYETVNLSTTVAGAAISQDLGVITMSADTGGSATLNVTGTNAITAGIITADVINFSGMTAQATGTSTASMGGNDPVLVGATAHTITGSPGDDTLAAAAAIAATIEGGAGADGITGSSAADTLNGGDGIDTIAGAEGNDTINGGAGNDIIDAGNNASTVTIDGGAGDDTINMDGLLDSTDTVAGGDGTDVLAVDAVTTAASAAAVSGFEVLRVDTGSQDHAMANYAGSNVFTSVQVNVNGTVTASTAGTSLASVSFGATAGSSSDFTMSRLVDGAADSFIINAPATGNVVYNDISLIDEETITINSGTGTFVMDKLTATDLTSLTLAGVGGIDLATGAGADKIVGATKLATLDASGVTGPVDIIASASLVDMTVTGPAAGVMDVTTGNGADTVTTGTGNDIILTGVGVDTITSGSGNDTITAGGHADTIISGAGDDTIIGGAGNDSITTGAGADDIQLQAAVSNGVDTITDFTPGTDDIKIATGTTLMGAVGTVRTTTTGTGDVVLSDNDVEFISINGAVGNLETGGSLSLTESDLTATTLTNLAAYLDERFNASGASDDALFVVNWTASGTNAYIYHLENTGDAAIAASELTHVAIVNHGLATTPMVTGDIIA
jgi:Ca2+-binding RTX toxin-like protein